jgi:hypothetical protein
MRARALIIGTLFALGCGGNDEVIPGDGAPGSTIDGALVDGADLDGADLDGGDLDGEPGLDAGLDATPGEGIACGTMTCDATAEVCCATTGAMGLEYACIDAGDSCGGTVLECDGPEDCGMDEVCCATYGAGTASSSCETTCTGVRLCQVKDDCPANQNCCSSQFVPGKACVFGPCFGM